MTYNNDQQTPLLKLPNTFRAFYGAFARLHKIQQQAIDPILNGEDLIVQSATGTGKSEAVLAPSLEKVILSSRTVSVLYIIPTRALTIDLKRRFESIIKERLDLKLAIRTGDVKNSLTTIPDIMFTTPESLDVMLGSANSDIKGFLARIKIVIIDEVHQLVNQYRGCHLAFLFTRLERRTGCKLQKITMSATIAHKDQIIECFGFDLSAQHIIDSVKRKIIARFIHIKKEDSELPALINDLHETWQYKKILIFANSRSACDKLFSILNQTGAFKDFSQLHYSNLKPLERKEAEKRFRKDSKALCIATSTLELGIDVGDVDAVILYEPPGSVSSFLQRAGRANRRKDKINVWGICRGERAGDQVLRFLALLELSGAGKIETEEYKSMPSVLSQQIISCLYEKKQLSVKAMTSLFPEYGNIMPLIFSSLEKKRWLSALKISGLFNGGWQYNKHLFEYKIWGNFPEAEEAYILEVYDKPIADIPKSIVGQMDVGEIVFIAGKRLKILKIDHGEHKKVFAKPGTGKEEKQLSWIGMGALVSFEVAKAMEGILKIGKINNEDCLFKRTKKLLKINLTLYKDKVVLENKIEIISSLKASYRYLTFIGALGNLILEWAVKEYFSDDELYITSNETGLECSYLIKFEELNLPVNRETLQLWVKNHFKMLSSIFALNLYCKTLPKPLIIQELTDFLYDPRVMIFFEYCLTHTSDVISGDIATIELQNKIEEPLESDPIDIMPGDSLLEREKKNSASVKEMKLPEYKNRYTLTATMISDYFFHGQCKKRFASKFFRLDTPSTDLVAENNKNLENRQFESDKLRDAIIEKTIEKGVRHEVQVLNSLKNQGQNIIFMETAGSFDTRFKTFLKTVKILAGKLESKADSLKDPIFLSQCMLQGDMFQSKISQSEILHVDALKTASSKTVVLKSDDKQTDLSEKNLNINDRANNKNFKIFPLGIPDLLVLSKSEPDKQQKRDNNRQIVLEAGDIKSSVSAQYHQKWQVAFYALLLKQIIVTHKLPVKLARTGFILTRNHDGIYKTERFNLKPYLTAFPMLLNTILTLVRNPGERPKGRLQPHCVLCDMYSFCYQHALEHEDIQFLPELSSGTLLKLRQMGWNTITKAYKALEKLSPGFNLQNDTEDNSVPLSSEKAGELFGQCKALHDNRIYIKTKKTRLYPENISYCIFIHSIKNPVTGIVSALGLRVIDKNFSKIQSHVCLSSVDLSSNNLSCFYIIENMQNSEKIWNQFSSNISKIWQTGLQNNKIPHIFYFGSGTKRAVLEWGEYHHKIQPAFLWQTQPDHWTNIQKFFTRHFYMPAPGIVSLETLAHIFGCETCHNSSGSEPSGSDLPVSQPQESELWEYKESVSKQPATLFHHSNQENIVSKNLESNIRSNLTIMVELYKKADHYLESQWTQECGYEEDQTKGQLPLYSRFINEEQRLHQDNILSLQELPLNLRVQKFRAVGNLRFTQTRLDEEGRFLYILKSSRKIISKFRKGDFLKLVPNGISNLQDGFPVILIEYNPEIKEISIRARSGKMHLNSQLLYSLEEDITQWNHEKLTHVAKYCFSNNTFFLQQFLCGQATDRQKDESLVWAEHWLTTINHKLNLSQQHALLMPFKYKNSMIQGPPGTGKTYLLGWILIALIIQAKLSNNPLRIGVTALTHQAIDNILHKVVNIINEYIPGSFPCRCIKWGQPKQSEYTKSTDDEKYDKNMTMVEFTNTAEDILSSSLVIVGATGYGFYNLFNSRHNEFPRALDWIIFDEASQVQIPQALLSLVYSKGNFLFLGDVNQLSPIVHGKYEESETSKAFNPAKSILKNFQELYSESRQATLDISYRMNKEICNFPGKTWYKKKLYPVDEIADNRLFLPIPKKQPLTSRELEFDAILDPAKPSVLVLTETEGCSTKSEIEAELMTQLAYRLMITFSIKPEQIALISPHRAQNNTIASKLETLLALNDKNPIVLPLIDTIERIQGAQRDIIIFGLTSSDPDHILTDFLNNPNRLNVAITRAKTKLIIIGSKAFFHAIPDSEKMLAKNCCFKALYEDRKKEDSLFIIKKTDL